MLKRNEILGILPVEMDIYTFDLLPDFATKKFEKYQVLQKTYNRFSAIKHDQADEQENAEMKGKIC